MINFISTQIKNRNPWQVFSALISVGLLLLGLSINANAAQPQPYLVLCYHSVPAKYNGDPDAISATNLAEQLSWLRDRGYVGISMNDVLEAKAGRKPLPALSFMLTVDDGYEDFYINAFPILKLYKVPAVFGLVGRWMEEKRSAEDQNLTDPYFAKQRFVTWAQVNEMADSGLVEMASHSYDLHHGILANPQNSTQPAAVTLQYDAEKQQYETPQQLRLRIRADLQKNSALIAKHTGKSPRIMVWPYGAMDGIGAEEAARAGMPINFTLADGLASTVDTEAVARTLVGEELTLSSFSYTVQHGHLPKGSDPIRAIRLSLDRLYDIDPVKQDENLGRAMNQIARLGINKVLLQAFVAPAQDGTVREAYFPNSILPMRSDFLNRVAWQLRTRLAVDVFIRIDSSKFAREENGALHRLDFSNARDRENLLKLYGELGLNTKLQGLMFDGTRTDAAQLGFNAALLKRMNYYPTPTLYYTGDGAVAPGNIKGKTTSATPDGIDVPLTIAMPVNAAPAELEAFVRDLTPDQVHILTFPVKGASIKDLENIVTKMRFFQHRGIADFLLDSDDFLDDPVKLDLVRKAVSLNNNPLVLLGK